MGEAHSEHGGSENGQRVRFDSLKARDHLEWWKHNARIDVNDGLRDVVHLTRVWRLPSSACDAV